MNLFVGADDSFESIGGGDEQVSGAREVLSSVTDHLALAHALPLCSHVLTCCDIK